MSLGIDWTETLLNWMPSDGDCELIPPDSPIIDQVIELAKVCVGKSMDKMVQINERTLRCTRLDKTNKWDLLELLALQLKEHRKIWRTHINADSMTNNLTVELPIVIPNQKLLRYLKLFIKDGQTKLATPNSISCIIVNYHESKIFVEVIYV